MFTSRAAIVRLLHGVLLCGGLAFGTASVVEADVKFHPGHYRTTNAGSGMRNAEAALRHPGTAGVSVSIKWRDIEPEKGNIKFELMDQWVDFVNQYGKQLVVRIVERSFSKGDGPLPGFVVADGCQVQKKSAGVQFALYEAKCMDHFIDLTTAIGRKYNGQSAFEGILGLENALGIIVKENTPSARATQYERLLQAASQAMPNTLYIQSLTFERVRGELDALAQTVANTGSGGLTTPDLCANKDFPSYETFRKNKGKLVIAPQAQRNACRGDSLGSTEERAFKAIDDLGAHYIFWTTAEDLDRATILETNTNCPSSLSGGCRR